MNPLFSLLGGGERDRTDDLLRAKQVLSQLSYTPNEIEDLRLRIYSFFQSEFRIPNPGWWA